MKSCALFGPKEFPCPPKKELIAFLDNLIENQGVDQFYVGNEGPFDAMLHWLLYGLTQAHSPIHYVIILASEPSNISSSEYFDAYFPPELRDLPLPEAIAKRDEWMIQHSDISVRWNH